MRFYPENIPYAILNVGFRQLERYSAPGSKSLPRYENELLSLGSLKLTSKFHVRRRREPSVSIDRGNDQIVRSDDISVSSRAKMDFDTIYFEIRIKW